MNNFFLLLGRISPLYVMIFFGFLAGRFLKADRESIAKIALYFVVPVVVFNSFATMPKGNTFLLLPVMFFGCALLIMGLFMCVGKILPSTVDRRVLSASAGSSNTGYFGAPLIAAVFGDRYLSIAIIATLGLIIYENTVSYYVISRSQHGAKDAFIKMASLPSGYAALFGIIVNKAGWEIPHTLANNITYFRGAYVVLGMMIIGLALATVSRTHIDISFASLAFLAKFVVYPLLVASLIYIDNHGTHFFSERVHNIALVLSATPMAANMVSFATHAKIDPEKIAVTIFLSTIFALVYLPVFVAVFVN